MTLMPEPSPEDHVALTEVAKTLLSALATAGGFLMGGPVGAGVGAAAAQASASALESLGSKWRRKAEADAVCALAVAVEESGIPANDLADTIGADSNLMLLTMTALQAASETALRSKVRLMGHVIANAATDRALVDDGLLFARAVRLLEAPHLRVLVLLDDPPRYDGDAEGQATIRWSPSQIAVRLDWPSTSVTAVLMTLQSASCAVLTSAKIDGGADTYRDLMTVRQPVALNEMSCEITDFGSHLLQELTSGDEAGR